MLYSARHAVLLCTSTMAWKWFDSVSQRYSGSMRTNFFTRSIVQTSEARTCNAPPRRETAGYKSPVALAVCVRTVPPSRAQPGTKTGVARRAETAAAPPIRSVCVVMQPIVNQSLCPYLRCKSPSGCRRGSPSRVFARWFVL